jgi:hypothetical protein
MTWIPLNLDTISVFRDECSDGCYIIAYQVDSKGNFTDEFLKVYYGGYPYFSYDPNKTPDWAVPDVAPAQDPSQNKCECGSGNDDISGAHSHWCRRYLRP